MFYFCAVMISQFPVFSPLLNCFVVSIKSFKNLLNKTEYDILICTFITQVAFIIKLFLIYATFLLNRRDLISPFKQSVV